MCQIVVVRKVIVSVGPNRVVGARNGNSAEAVLNAVHWEVTADYVLGQRLRYWLQHHSSRVGEGAAESKDLLILESFVNSDGLTGDQFDVRVEQIRVDLALFEAIARFVGLKDQHKTRVFGPNQWRKVIAITAITDTNGVWIRNRFL